MGDILDEGPSSFLLDYVPKDKESKIFIVLGASVRSPPLKLCIKS